MYRISFIYMKHFKFHFFHCFILIQSWSSLHSSRFAAIFNENPLKLVSRTASKTASIKKFFAWIVPMEMSLLAIDQQKID